MESSEDDAGAATNASRRVSAREKDVGQIEDVNATSSFQQDQSEPRTSCETPAMSEDNFDGDSVPSPSTHDVNTSTEAILDMIDEIVDGPGAPKRLPLAQENDTDSRFAGGGDSDIPIANFNSDEITLKSQPSDPAASAKIEDERCLQSTSSNVTSESEVLADVKVDCVELLPRTSSPIPTSNDLAVIKDTRKDAVSCSEEPQGSSVPNIPSSSVVQTVKSVLETESSPCERTVKTVTSSDKRDNVIVESAESTSSDNSISEGRAPIVESVTRSPLRRRLVRPLPNRPDSTVSSTVDSSINIQTSEQASECIVKDVSSSSDAVPTVHGNIKPEEIRNISEVSICKAETSGSPMKKIKLVRQKVNPQMSSTQVELTVDKQSTRTQIDQCQSTSSDISISPAEPCINTVSEVQTVNNAELVIQSDPNSENLPIESPQKEVEVLPENSKGTSCSNEVPQVCTSQVDISSEKDSEEEQEKLSPLKITISTTSVPESIESTHQNINIEKNINTDVAVISEEIESSKQVPKLTIKLGNKHTEELKSPVPKFTIKPIWPSSDSKAEQEEKEQIPHVTKLNIKPITKHPEKINEVHRKSSSSEISESECSENDESTSTSDQASASDQGPTEVVPKVTIKLGKPGTESEGQFYTEKNIPKLTIKTIQNCEIQEQSSPTKMKIVLSQSEDTPIDKVPKLTIKTVAKCEGQPLSPKLIIKPIKPPDEIGRENSAENVQSSEIPKLKISTETLSTSVEGKDAVHVPKITIKPISKSESEISSKSKKLSSYENTENIPVVTKLNIKPLIKPDNIELSEGLDEKVPVVSKLNIKPVVKPKDSEIDCSRDDVPKITKLNIKPLKSPEIKTSEQDCDVLKTDVDENSIPVITKLNIKPIVKPLDEDSLKDNENQSSETGNSSDDNSDQIPVVTKINIKPICKPNDMEESGPSKKKEESIPVITKLNIKPVLKPDESILPLSPKKEISKVTSTTTPIMKLNIKPVLKPEEIKEKEVSLNEVEEAPTKNPPLLMKINRKSAVNENEYTIDKNNDHEHCNNVTDDFISVLPKISIKPIIKKPNEDSGEPVNMDLEKSDINCKLIPSKSCEIELKDQTTNKNPSELLQNCVSGLHKEEEKEKSPTEKALTPSLNDNSSENTELKISSAEVRSIIVDYASQNITTPEETIANSIDDNASDNLTNLQYDSVSLVKTAEERMKTRSMPVRQNCTLLKKLLETRKEKTQENELENKPNLANDPSKSPSKNLNIKNDFIDKVKETKNDSVDIKESIITDLVCSVPPLTVRSMQELCKEANENVTKPLEINVSEKISQPSSDQDSPRIILKINKTDQGASAKIITEETNKSDVQCYSPENTHDIVNDVNQKKNFLNSRRKPHTDTPMPMGKRLRSSRILQSSDKSPPAKRNIGKRPSPTETTPMQSKEAELAALETKRLKIGQIFSNKSLTITPIKASPVSPPVKPLEIKQGSRNHTLLNNENCAKNGSSKLHNILSNLQAKQLQAMPFSDLNHTENSQSLSPDLKSSTSTCSPEPISDNLSIEKARPEVQMIFNDNSESRDFSIEPVEMARDPLEMDNLKPNEFLHDIPKPVEMTPQPKKRGRPRKLPVSEGAKTVISLPVTALEERPQRSLRLSRDRPVLLLKPRGRGRGRGRRLDTEPNSSTGEDHAVETANKFFIEQRQDEEIDPTSSRIKLPRMTEALDKMPSVCSTPLTSRRRTSSTELQLFGSNPDLKVVLETSLPKMEDPFSKSPEMISEGRGRGGRGGRGSRGGRGRAAARSPRGRGRGRGGGRGAMYMKETLGIYGRVCGPATTTVQLFEEETCMMDDNATPAKLSHLLDEDSQSSVKSSTNDSNKMKKSKFADLFDSNKVWTAADVKEYTWPASDKIDGEPQVMMIQEQVAMFLSVKSFKRRYPELKRRPITGEERDYVLSKGLVTEALCDLGITAVDASEVLDIMLSDYPHKYEEFRSHQREKQLAEPEDEVMEESKSDVKIEKMDFKEQKSSEQKPEAPKVDPEKTRQDMAAAAIASASEWNARMNAQRRPACADLQSLTVQRRRAPPPPPRLRVRPPHGFYPHALLPGQYQHCYRVYAPQDLRYFPLNTALAAPPAPPSPVESSSESDAEWGSRCSSSDSGQDVMRSAKRKKLTKTKRSSQAEASTVKEEEAETCRVCKLRIEANRKYTHERFLVCANCNAKLHPSCVELGADTIRKCREYAWQCAECKTCCACRRPADDDKMLFCDLCDRGFHIYCVGLQAVPNGRWHCVECAICKSCGAREPGGAGGAGGADADWHHQTRRGPGGHKLYSHSLCSPCARAYRIGRYCPLCDRSFIGPKGTMQLVICKLCDRQLHQECVRQTVSALNVLDYTCGECRRGGITSRAAAVRLAPRTIATLFMAKRRFNKYAHRQYLQSRLRPDDAVS